MPMSWDAETWVRILSFVPIVACSVIGFALALAKWAQSRRAIQSAAPLMMQVRPLIGGRDYGRALAVARANRSPAALVVEQALTGEGRSPRRLAERIERAGREAVRVLDYGLGGLSLIATLGPLFGLLGTVVGIVIVFNRLAAAEGLVSPGQLAGGIGTALYTTIAGLVVGICAMVSHRWLAARCDHATAQLLAIGYELLELTGENER
jgi:biopolymer transport protein ExbB